MGRFPSAEAGGSPLQMGKPWPLAGCWEKAQQSTRGPGGRNDFPWGWQIVVSSARARVSRQACRVGKTIFPAPTHPCASGCGSSPAWGNLLRRDSPRPLSDLFAPPKHPFWRKFFETFPSAEAGGSFLQTGKPWPLAGCWEKAQQSTRGPGDGNRFPWRWQVSMPLVCARVSRRRVAGGKLSSPRPRTLARVGAGPYPPAGVSRGGGFLPGCNAILRGWERALARRAPARPACIIPLCKGRGQPLGGRGPVIK